MFAARRLFARGLRPQTVQLCNSRRVLAVQSEFGRETRDVSAFAQPRVLAPAAAQNLVTAARRLGGNSGLWAPDGELAKRAIEKKISDPLAGELEPSMPEEVVADHSWRQSNHIWSDEELKNVTKVHHEPLCFSDHVMRGIMRTLYYSFNFITGYKEVNPTVTSVGWRLIILESFAGVPGFVAAAFRHFYSLRTLKRDHGSIYTFLEEAENERMHLLVCMKMFDASFLTRSLVITAQISMTPFLVAVYLVKPGAMHRFVGYLEETAVMTYSNLIAKAREPGSHLHAAWDGVPAPAIAKTYWKLRPDATWIEALRHILADESHHRDVNHTFATLPEGASNPFIKQHMGDFDRHAADRITTLLKANQGR